jgi:hypothetical protein
VMANGLLMIMYLLSAHAVSLPWQHAVDHPTSLPRELGHDREMAKIPDSTKASLHQRLTERSRQRWPQLNEIQIRYRAGFAYVDGLLAGGEVLRLCRLRYAGSARDWGFAMYRASHDDYQDCSYQPGSWAARLKTLKTPPAASTLQTRPPGPEPPTNLRPRPLAPRTAGDVNSPA